MKETLYGKNIGEKRILVVVAVLVLIFAGVVVGFAYGALANTQANNLTKTVPITSDIGMAFGYNGTGKDPTWVAATLTASGTSEVLSFPSGFNATNIVVFERSPMYDVQGLLNTSLVFTTVNVKIAMLNVTGVSETVTSNLTYVDQIFGAQVNDTSMHSLSDKGVVAANIFSSVEIYNSQTNNLNQTVEVPTFGLLATNFKDFSTIEIGLNGSVASTNHLSISLAQTYGSPFDINIITLTQTVFVVLGILILIGVFAGLPRIRGGK